MKKLLWLLLPALAAYGAWDLVREVRGTWTSDYSRTYSRAVGQTMSRASISLNLSGRGVRIGVLDAGFGASAPSAGRGGCTVAAWRDFTGGDETAFFDDATDHGTRVCTNLGGRSGDTIRGLAWGAEYYLAKTDRAEVEPRAEERQLIRGIEWLLAHDVDVISSSLGYTTFDDFSGIRPRCSTAAPRRSRATSTACSRRAPDSFSCRAPATRATRRGAMSPFRPMSGRSSRSVRAIPTVFPAPAPVVSDAKMSAM